MSLHHHWPLQVYARLDREQAVRRGESLGYGTCDSNVNLWYAGSNAKELLELEELVLVIQLDAKEGETAAVGMVADSLVVGEPRKTGGCLSLVYQWDVYRHCKRHVRSLQNQSKRHDRSCE